MGASKLARLMALPRRVRLSVALAREVSESEGLHYQGVMFYPGHIRMPLAEQGPALAEVSRRLGTFLEALGAAGLTPGVVSGGSTPTLWRSHEVVGMNEIRPGITPFFDRASL